MNPRRSTRSLATRLALVGLAAALSVTTLAPLGGCEKPRDKAAKIVSDGSLIGVTIEEGNKIVGKEAIKHDEFNAYWDMGEGNGVIQVLVRGGKISRVEHAEKFEARAARDNTPSHPDAKNELQPTIDELERANPPAGGDESDPGTPPAPTGG